MKIKRILSYLLISLLLLSLSACKKEAEIGSDWRTTGVIDGYGEIIRKDKTTKVAVVAANDGIALYLDDDSHTLFDLVEIPKDITNMDEVFESISFDDLDGDGSSDITITLNNQEEKLVWIYYELDGYQLQEN